MEEAASSDRSTAPGYEVTSYQLFVPHSGTTKRGALPTRKFRMPGLLACSSKNEGCWQRVRLSAVVESHVEQWSSDCTEESSGQILTSSTFSRWDECQSGGSDHEKGGCSSRCSQPFQHLQRGRSEQCSTSTLTAEVQVDLLTPSKEESARQLGHQLSNLVQEVSRFCPPSTCL